MTDTLSKDTAFRLFQDLAEDLSSGTLHIPTFLHASKGLRDALTREEWSNKELSNLVSGEPLLSARVVALANSAALNPSGQTVSDVKTACARVGHKVIRSMAASMLVEQAALAKDMLPFAPLAQRVWVHSLEVAVMSYVLARHTRRWPPDEAMFAGLVHDMGYFYIYWRAARFVELVGHPEEIKALARAWHPAIGQRLIWDLALPDVVATACDEHEIDSTLLPEGSLSEVLSLANGCANATAESDPPGTDTEITERMTIAQARPVIDTARTEVNELIAMLQGVAQTS